MIALALAALAVSFRPNWFVSVKVEQIFRAGSAALNKCGQHPRLCLLAVFLIPIVLRLCLINVVPVPQPRSHDEFSYLLGAETFASGRLTNPTPAMWKFFETEHEIMVPTYQSKYPPAQALFMAAGLVVFRSAWAGVLISFGAMFAATYWMARAYMPHRFALLTAALPLVQPGLGSYWVNSYYGGCVVATGAALVFGACARLKRKWTVLNWTILSIGLVLIANSRPFDGLVVAVPPLIALLYQVIRKGLSFASARSLARQLVLPVLLGVLAIAAMLHYNYSVTGNPLVMPYAEWQKQYSPIRPFVGLKLLPEPHYNCSILRDNYVRCEILDYNAVSTPAQWLSTICTKRIPIAILFFCGFWLLPFAFFSVLSFRDSKITVLWCAFAAMAVAVGSEVYYQRHYMAPIAAPLVVLFVQGWRHLRQVKFKDIPLGFSLSRLLLLILAGGALQMLFSLTETAKVMKAEQDEFPRVRINKELSALPGKHLVLVHYAQGHNPRREYVVNDADIARQKIIWARDLGAENQTLFDHYPDRTIWLFDPDASGGPKLFTYEESKHTELSREVNGDAWLKP